MKRLFAYTLMLFATAPSLAADANGYTAKYECRAGGPKCDIDVTALSQLACNQTITTATTPKTDWSAINWSNRVICIQAGDHTGRGTLTISSSGTSGTRKVLRYTRSDDNGDKPWKQGEPSGQAVNYQAKIKRIILDGADYWLLHRLTVDGQKTNAGIGIIELVDGSSSSNIIIDSVLVQNAYMHSVSFAGPYHDNLWIQNSVIRNCGVWDNDNSGVYVAGGPQVVRVVNNEVYDCTKEMYVSDHGAPGIIVENNDFYITSALYTDCNGNYNGTGPCAAAEIPVNTKGGGTSTDPMVFTHNRVWGARFSDTGICCAGGTQGMAISTATNPGYPAPNYVLIQNNIIMDSQQGIDSYWGTRRAETTHTLEISYTTSDGSKQILSHSRFALPTRKIQNTI